MDIILSENFMNIEEYCSELYAIATENWPGNHGNIAMAQCSKTRLLLV